MVYHCQPERGIGCHSGSESRHIVKASCRSKGGLKLSNVSDWTPHPDAPEDATPEAPWGYTREGTPRKRKPRKDIGQSRSRTRKPDASRKQTKKPPKPDPLWLEKWEARIATEGIGRYLTRTFPDFRFDLPDTDSIKRLAHVFERLGALPPLSFIQPSIRRIASLTGIAGAGPKAGTSLFGDLAQYVYGWYKANPGEFVAVYSTLVSEGRIPPVPGVPVYPSGVPSDVSDLYRMGANMGLSEDEMTTAFNMAAGMAAGMGGDPGGPTREQFNAMNPE